MRAILELPEVRTRIFPLSVKAYEVLAETGGLERQVELFRGIVVRKPPKSPLYCTIVRRIYIHLLAFECSELTVFSGCPLRLADSMPEPDVMIVRGAEGDFDTKHPTAAVLVVEVADGGVELDRENASLYAEAGVPEYWIVLGNERQIEVYHQPENGVYRQKRLYSVGETLACASVPDLQAVLVDWFA